MPDEPHIRAVTRDDLPALKRVIDACALFPSGLLDEMVAGHLEQPSDKEIWLTVDDGGPVAVAFCAPEDMTEGTWNLYLIAVHPERQGQGLGRALMAYIERTLAARGQRILLVETSGNEEFARTRAFYHDCGYEEEARIREFYQAGEDKIVFRKALV